MVKSGYGMIVAAEISKSLGHAEAWRVELLRRAVRAFAARCREQTT